MEDPDVIFQETYNYIEDNFDGEDEKKRRKKYIKDGIRAGFDELVKMTEPILLRGAMSFLILCNNKHGPPFCRAMLSVLDETGHLSDSDNEKWGKINYSNGIDERPEDESKWYNILSQDSADIVHWYQQLCLNWEVVLND